MVVLLLVMGSVTENVAVLQIDWAMVKRHVGVNEDCCIVALLNSVAISLVAYFLLAICLST